VLNIITKKLYQLLPPEHGLLVHRVVDGSDFYTMLDVYKQDAPEKITIFDATSDFNMKFQEIVPVRDHINKTGENILIHLRKKIKGEFFDISNLYENNKDGIITTCFGESLKNNVSYPSYHLCHFAVLARAVNIQHVHAYLYNTHKSGQ